MPISSDGAFQRVLLLQINDVISIDPNNINEVGGFRWRKRISINRYEAEKCCAGGLNVFKLKILPFRMHDNHSQITRQNDILETLDKIYISKSIVSIASQKDVPGTRRVRITNIYT